MRILYDHQIFTQQNYGGVSRYFCQLMSQFWKDPSVDFSIALRCSQNKNLQKFSQLDAYWSNRSDFLSKTQLFSFIQRTTRRDIFTFLLNNKILCIGQGESVRLLKKQNFDIFHPTYYDPYFLEHLGKIPFVLTVYDMIHEVHPAYFSSKDPTTRWKKQLIEKADEIIAISESTKRDILRFINIDPNKIQVIYLGNPFESMPGSDVMVNNSAYSSMDEKSYILFVGNRSSYKNFKFFIEAIAPLLLKDIRLHVCCAGGEPFSPHEIKYLKNLRIFHKVHHVQPNDHIMKNLYKNALVFVFPSLYEGFGLPVLEAFSCGCPTLLSNISSLPEIGGDAALYFDPYDSVSLTDVMERIISDNALRMQLILRGYERSKLFSWEKTGCATKKVYENAITII